MSQQRSGPPAPPSMEGSRPKDSERTTRRPAQTWDRVRVGIFLLVAFLLITAAGTSSTGLTFREVLREQASARWWLLALIALEMLRQFHYFFEEQSESYYAFWRRAWRRRATMGEGMDPWTRYRLARVTKLVVFLWILGAILASFFSGSDGVQYNALTALLAVPGKVREAFGQIIYFAFIISIGMLQFVAIFWLMSKGGVETIMPDEIETRFSDVKGQDAVLDRVKENLVFLENPEAIEERGGYVPSGILLWGPPGTGKTLMAQAVAGETGKPYVAVDPGAFINMFLGVGILKVRALYRKLRKLAQRYDGVLVFFDEADSLGNRGAISNPGGGWSFEPTPWTTGPACNGTAYLSQPSRQAVFTGFGPGIDPGRQSIFVGGMGGGGMGTLQQLLSQMDGLKKPRGLINRIRRWLGMKPTPPPKYRILHIFATNQPQALDEAMLRPGRIDRLYKVGYPHLEGRKSTFMYYLDKVRHELTDEHVTKLATITPYASGASIKDMVNEALVIAIRDGRDAITYEDVIKAKQIKQHGLPDDHEYIERERHSVAVHEACHAVVAYRLRKHMIIDIATIERRGDVGGFVSSLPPEDQFVTWQSEREIDIMTFLASLAGERLFFDGDHSTGVGGDMRGATGLTMQMLAYYAMGPTIASHAITKAALGGAQPIESGADRNIWDGEFGKQVEARLRELYDRTMRILEENRHEVLSVAHALETRKTITGEDVEAIIEGRQGALLDGRPYHDSRFAEELERYHAAASAAHAEHGDVSEQVPVPIPPAPVDLLDEIAGNGHRDRDRDQVRIGPEDGSGPPTS